MSVLHCYSKGDSRFSAFFAKVKVGDKFDSIENHYQLSKRFGSFAPKHWKQAKGKEGMTHFTVDGNNYPLELFGQWYKLLWLKYLDNNPDLAEYASQFDEFLDIFRGKSINCQADVVEQYVKQGRQSILDECQPLLKSMEKGGIMIVYITKDVLKVKIDDFIIAHQTNCMGKMGAGVALAIRQAYPEVYEHYLAEHSLGLLELGYTSYVPVGENAFVANMCGQYRYGRDKRYTDYVSLKKCLEDVKIMAESLNCDVVLPYKLGCNNAGGDWREVYVMIDEVFKGELVIELFEGDEE